MSEPTAVRPLEGSDLASRHSTKESYERVPYRSSAWPSCRPERLEAIARLHGVAAAGADCCRVIEIGCGDGGNLVPLAVAHPGSEFLGLDLAEVHVARGRRTGAELGLENLRFETGSFDHFDAGAGGWNYVLAHGLLSWVTPRLQEHLFAACRRLLAPGGVAFLSYNTWPGWSLRHGIREMLRQHCRGTSGIEARVARSRELLGALASSLPAGESAWGAEIRSLAAVAANPEREHYFAHEYLEDENHPFWVRDFVERAQRAGLAYLADADLVDAQFDALPAEEATALRSLASGRVDRMQLSDCALDRKFRQSLLCRAEDRPFELPDLRRVAECWVLSPLTPVSPDPQVTGAEPLALRAGSHHAVEVDEPLVKAALMRFCEVGPHPVAFDELLAWSRHRIGEPPRPDPARLDAERDLLCGVLGRLFLADLIELQASPPCWAASPGEKPRASALVRRDATRADCTTTLRHRTLSLGDAGVRAVLARLDGSRNRTDLARELAGQLTRERIDEILRLAARGGLLLPEPA